MKKLGIPIGEHPFVTQILTAVKSQFFTGESTSSPFLVGDPQPKDLYYIVLRKRGHLDDWASLWALLELCPHLFRWDISLRLILIAKDGELESPEIARLLDSGQAVALDIGGERLGCIDHHPHAKHPNQCTFSRIVALAGLAEDRATQELDRYITRLDTGGSEDLRDMEGTSQILLRDLYYDDEGNNWRGPSDPEVFELVTIHKMREVRAVWRDRRRRFSELTEQLAAGCQEYWVVMGGKNRVISVYQGPDWPYVKQVRFKNEDVAVVMIDETGNVRVFVNPMYGLGLLDFVKIMRWLLSRRKGIEISPLDLDQDGSVKGLEEIYVPFPTWGVMLNGTDPDQCPLLEHFTIAEIVEYLEIGLKSNFFARPNKQMGFLGCPVNRGDLHCLGAQCPIYGAALDRCLNFEIIE